MCAAIGCLRGAKLGVGGGTINAFSKPASVYLFWDTCIEALKRLVRHVSLVVAE